MAIRPILTVLQSNYDVAASASFHAGDVLARQSTGLVQAADRSADAATAIVGISADDKARIGNTMILIDPVGSTYVDGGGNLIANNNGYYVAAKRALADYQDETVTNISDLTSGSSGYEGPRRGVGAYSTPSGQFVSDRFAAVATSSSSADSGAAITFAINDPLTYGAGANAGKLIKLADPSHGKLVAVVDQYDSVAGLLYYTMK